MSSSDFNQSVLSHSNALQAAAVASNLIPMQFASTSIPAPQLEDDYGRLLLELLAFFSYEFDFSTMGITFDTQRPRDWLFPSAKLVLHEIFCQLISLPLPFSFRYFYRLTEPSGTLNIEDPHQFDVNIGKSVHATWRIQMMFAETLSGIVTESDSTMLSRVISGTPRPSPPKEQ